MFFNKMTTTWNNSLTSVIHTKRNGDKLILNVGDCIVYDGRELPVRIENFTGIKEPIGFTYLPWRGERWATPAFSIKGNARHMICYPGGLIHYGQHMNWESVKVVPNPERIQNEEMYTTNI